LRPERKPKQQNIKKEQLSLWGKMNARKRNPEVLLNHRLTVWLVSVPKELRGEEKVNVEERTPPPRRGRQEHPPATTRSEAG